MQAVQQEAKQGGAERTALFHAAGRLHAVAAPAAHADGILCSVVQRLDSTQEGVGHTQALQRLPQEIPRYAVVRALEIQEAAKQRVFQVGRAIDEVLKGEHRVQRGHARSEASLRGRTEACSLGVLYQAYVDEGRVQAQDWLPNCNGAVVTGLGGIAALVDRDHQAAVNSSRQSACTEPTIEHGCEGRQEQVWRRFVRVAPGAKGVAKQLRRQAAGAHRAAIAQALERVKYFLRAEGPAEFLIWAALGLPRQMPE